MIRNMYRYVMTLIDIASMLRDFGNKFVFVAQERYKGKVDKSTNQMVLPPGVKVALQIVEDHSDPIVDKDTGEVLEDNTLETFEVTIPGADFPLPFKKGDFVSLGECDVKNTHYVNFTPILRFKSIHPYKTEEKK